MSIPYGIKGGQLPMFGRFNEWVKTYNSVKNARCVAYISNWDSTNSNQNMMMAANIPSSTLYDITLVSFYLGGSFDSSTSLPLYPNLYDITDIDGTTIPFVESFLGDSQIGTHRYDSDGKKRTFVFTIRSKRYAIATSLANKDCKLTLHPSVIDNPTAIQITPKNTGFYGMFVFFTAKTPSYMAKITNNELTAETYNAWLNMYNTYIFTLPLSLRPTVGDSYAPDGLSITDIGNGSRSFSYGLKHRFNSTNKDFYKAQVFWESGSADPYNDKMEIYDGRYTYPISFTPDNAFSPYHYDYQNPINGQYAVSGKVKGEHDLSYGALSFFVIDSRLDYKYSTTHANIRFWEYDYDEGRTHLAVAAAGQPPNADALAQLNRMFSYMGNNRHAYLRLSPSYGGTDFFSSGSDGFGIDIIPYPSPEYMLFDPGFDAKAALNIGTMYLFFAM